MRLINGMSSNAPEASAVIRRIRKKPRRGAPNATPLDAWNAERDIGITTLMQIAHALDVSLAEFLAKRHLLETGATAMSPIAISTLCSTALRHRLPTLVA